MAVLRHSCSRRATLAQPCGREFPPLEATFREDPGAYPFTRNTSYDVHPPTPSALLPDLAGEAQGADRRRTHLRSRREVRAPGAVLPRRAGVVDYGKHLCKTYECPSSFCGLSRPLLGVDAVESRKRQQQENGRWRWPRTSSSLRPPILPEFLSAQADPARTDHLDLSPIRPSLWSAMDKWRLPQCELRPGGGGW